MPAPEKRHGPGIDKIPVKGWMGLLFTVAIMLVFLIALPPVRRFFLLTVPPGLLVGLILYLLNRRRS